MKAETAPYKYPVGSSSWTNSRRRRVGKSDESNSAEKRSKNTRRSGDGGVSSHWNGRPLRQSSMPVRGSNSIEDSPTVSLRIAEYLSHRPTKGWGAPRLSTPANRRPRPDRPRDRGGDERIRLRLGWANRGGRVPLSSSSRSPLEPRRSNSAPRSRNVFSQPRRPRDHRGVTDRIADGSSLVRRRDETLDSPSRRFHGMSFERPVRRSDETIQIVQWILTGDSGTGTDYTMNGSRSTVCGDRLTGTCQI